MSEADSIRTIDGRIQSGRTALEPDRRQELVLAAACAEGDPGAIALFERQFMARLPIHLRRMDLTPSQLDEVRQRLRISLLAGPKPGIATFSGRAPLDAWVRVAAIRMALRFLATDRIPVAEDTLLSSLLSPQAATDMAVDESARGPLRAALEQALRALEPRDRAILRLHSSGPGCCIG